MEAYPEVGQLLGVRGVQARPLHAGLTGSTAYGLSHVASDRDILAVVSYGLDNFGLYPPPAALVTLPNEPLEDVFLYEIRKYLELVAEGNPFAHEALLQDTGFCTPEFQSLRDLRHCIINKASVSAYLSFVTTQLALHKRNPLPGKRLYHSCRLLNSCEELLAGRLPLVEVPQHQRQELWDIKSGPF